MAVLSRITVFPVKALSGVEIKSCAVTSGGALLNDRQFALKDDNDRFVNGKCYAEVNRIVSTFNLEQQTISLGVDDVGETQVFELRRGNDQLEEWLSDFFGFNIRLEENIENGFPDDRQRSGPTVISTATLEEVTSWFPGLSLTDIRRRFRTNLELGDCSAFWEERLSQIPDQGVYFQIGKLLFEGLKHCLRCSVPAQNTDTGEAYPDFRKIFMQRREKTLPDWVDRSGFERFYNLAINTRLLNSTGDLVVGSNVTLP